MLSGQELLDYIGQSLGVRFEVTSNVSAICKSKITFSNDGCHSIPNGDWAIYTYHMRQIVSESIEIDAEHTVGGLFKLTTTHNFKKIEPGGKLEVPLSSDEPTVSRYSLFPNWYVAQDGFKPRVLEATASENLLFVDDFDTPKKWKKGKLDKSNPFTLEQRYKKYHIDEDIVKQGTSIIPTPLSSELNTNQCVDLAKGKWVVYNHAELFKKEARFLSEKLRLQLCEDLKSYDDAQIFSLNRARVENEFASDEAYKIEINAKKPSVTLTANSPAGMYYAIQTVFSLLDNHKEESSRILSSGMIVDAPRFPYRGLHVDVARNFIKAEEIKKLIRAMSMYKMNKLHFHLTDDEGWRLEIKDLPELTEVGAKRDHVLAAKGLAVEPTLGSGPHYKTPACGFYTVEEYQDILQCAVDHHVEVIPEIDMPGHSYAAVVAMTARYRRFEEQGDIAAAKEYMLVEIGEETSYVSVQRYTNDTMNPCLEGTKNFVAKIIATLKALHEPIQPLRVFHVGGDEVPMGAWDASPTCEKYYKENDLDGTDPFLDPKDSRNDDEIESENLTSALQEYFIQYVEDICGKEKLQLAVWNDGIRNPTLKQTMDTPKLVHAWRISRKTERHNPNILANSGFQVVISSATHTYFDHSYEPDPEENGLHWCVRMLDTETVFGMKPLDMYACQDERFEQVEHEKLKNENAIVGIQAHIWGELIRCSERLEYMLFPRLLALAERAWHAAPWEKEVCRSEQQQKRDWVQFASAIGHKELRRLERMDVRYRVPPPGIHVEGDDLFMGSVYPGFIYKFRKAGDQMWNDVTVPVAMKIFEQGQKYEFVTSTFDGTRLSRIVTRNF